MILPTIGNICIYAAALAAVVSGVLYILVWRGNERLRQPARYAFMALAGCIILTSIILMRLILTHQFVVAYVHSYSSSDLPLYYLISTFWAGQEGTFLLWIFYLSVIGLFLMRRSKSYEAGNMFFLNLFILSILAILIRKSPFELLPVTPAEGAGLNTLLQDFWMVIHPPTMFLGFSMASVPFLFAMTALVNRTYTEWTNAARRWTIFAWSVLGIAIVEGGYWAYKVLGWGGYWAWDPVENSSLIPWLFLTAQMHTLFVQKRRQSLTRLAIFMVSLTFISIQYGTFLTRSGVLSDFSVHSFIDLGINNFLISGMMLFILLAVVLMAYRWRDIAVHYPFDSILSRDYIITLAIILPTVGATLVLLGTSAPLITRLAEQQSAVSMDYYRVTMTPIAIAIALLLAIFPFFRWKRGLSGQAFLIGGAMAALFPAVIIASQTDISLMYVLLFFAIFWGLFSNLFLFVKELVNGNYLGHAVVHIGILLLLLGAASSNIFELKSRLMIQRGGSADAFGYVLNYTDRVTTPDGQEFVVAVDNGSDHFTATLRSDFDDYNKGMMHRPHIEKFASYDFYLSPVNLVESDKERPGMITLTKGSSLRIDKYDIMFTDFEAEHDENGPRSITAHIIVSYDGKEEHVEPTLAFTDGKLVPTPVGFDGPNGALFIAGVIPDEGKVMLQLVGDFLPEPVDTTPEVLVAELSIKPWISLFWIGAFVTFIGGFIAMIGAPGGRIRLWKKSPPATTDEQESIAAVTEDQRTAL